MVIKEELLHYIWRLKKFNQNNLLTTEGKPIKIHSFGFHNHSDGPDFLQAQVEIDRVKWSGSIEIHVKSSDWIAHNHSQDPSYENTILHVVYDHDREIKRPNGNPIPCLELKGCLDLSIINLYQQFDSTLWIPCQHLLSSSSDISRFLAKEKALNERIDQRWKNINISENLENNDWEETAYRLICRSFGLVHNADAFLAIAQRIPYSILKKKSDEVEVLESLFMGTAGLLSVESKDEYHKKLLSNYIFYKKKYKLKEESSISLKHKAVRPQNFPEVALSQFINLMKTPHVFSLFLNSDLKELEILLRVKAAPYWDNHYTFGNESVSKVKTLGKSKIHVIIINAIVPMLYFMSKKTGEEKWAQKANRLLEEIPSEKNSIINKWANIGVSSDSAYDSQALLELKKNYCDKKRCLYCPIGYNIMNTNN